MIPIIIEDNFFKDPKKVLKLCDECDFEKSSDGRWPGVRSKLLHKINLDFFKIFHSKIFALLYPYHYQHIDYAALSSFQKVDGNTYKNEGWVHTDPGEITAIVYLSKHEDCGTSFWESKLFEAPIHNDKKESIYLNKLPKQEELKYLNENNNQFTKILDVKSKFNRAIIFDAKKLHSASKFTDMSAESERTTLISFINGIKVKNDVFKSGVLESKRVD